LKQLDRIRVATPCPVGWEQMTGDNRVRFCGLCQLNVYNFAELTQTEAEDLLRTAEGRVCGRLYRRLDGTVITKDCPVGLRAMRRRVARTATAAFATVMSICTAVAGQTQSDRGKECKQQVKISSKLDKVPSDTGAVVGTLFDPNGAVIAGADIRIVDRQAHKTYRLRSDDEGRFTQRGLPAANYEVVIEYQGFKRLNLSSVKVTRGQIAVLEAILLVSEETVTVGVIALPSLIDTTPGVKTVITGDMIRKIPH